MEPLTQRIAQRFEASRTVTPEEFPRAVVQALHDLSLLENGAQHVREQLIGIALFLKDRRSFRDASTLMDLAENLTVVPSQVHEFLHRIRQQAPPPAPTPKPEKPGPKPNPWTKPL